MRLIDADALKNHIESYYDKVIFVGAVKCLIDNSPTIDAEPVKHGRWIRVTNGAIPEKYICPFCKRIVEDYDSEALISIRYPYCHCGARMDEVEE